MASESVDSLAPTDFQICISYEDQLGAISVAVERCQLCGSNKRTFYCKTCVSKGEITSSKGKNSERYADKMLKWNALKRSRSKLLYKVEDKMRRRIEVAQKQAEVEEVSRRLALTQVAIQQAQDDLEKEKQQLRDAQIGVTRKKMCIEERIKKKNNISAHLVKMENRMVMQKEKWTERESELATLRQQHIRYLIRDIFPIEKVQTEVEECTTTEGLLRDAKNTSYVRGRWVYTDSNSGELHYRIVDPTLPANGDYTPYLLSLQENKAAMPADSDFCPRNPGYSMSAALCYTSQLVNLLAYFLGVNVPRRLCYSEFCLADLDEDHFSKMVYKLNHNVLHMCFTQAVPVEELHPLQTIHNVLMLLKSVELGRAGAFLVDDSLMESLEFRRPKGLTDADDYNDSSSDDGGGVDGGEVWTSDSPPEAGGWEVPDTDDLPAHVDESYFVSTQSDSSLPSTGLMASAAASVASFWKTYTGSPKESPSKEAK